MPFQSKTSDGLRKCLTCKAKKPETDFSWHEAEHRYRDAICRACRAALKRGRYKPRFAIKPAIYPYGLRADLYDKLSDVDAAYIAGLIDGEGCIMSSYPKRRTNPLCIKVAMVHKPTIDWLGKTVSGTLTGQYIVKIPNSRTRWTWQIKGIRSYALLRRIARYMKTKREEADVALKMGKTFFAMQHRGKVQDSIHAQRDVFGQQLRDLKRKEWLVLSS